MCRAVHHRTGTLASSSATWVQGIRPSVQRLEGFLVQAVDALAKASLIQPSSHPAASPLPARPPGVRPAQASGAAGADSVALSAQDLQALPVLFRVDLTRGVPVREDLLGIVVSPRAPGPVRPWAPGRPGTRPRTPGPLRPWAPGRPGTRPRAAFPPYSGRGRSGPAAAGPADQRDDRPNDQAPEDERGEDTEPHAHPCTPVPQYHIIATGLLHHWTWCSHQQECRPLLNAPQAVAADSPSVPTACRHGQETRAGRDVDLLLGLEAASSGSKPASSGSKPASSGSKRPAQPGRRSDRRQRSPRP